MRFKLVSSFSPKGDQPQAVRRIVSGLKKKERFQTLQSPSLLKHISKDSLSPEKPEVLENRVEDGIFILEVVVEGSLC